MCGNRFSLLFVACCCLLSNLQQLLASDELFVREVAPLLAKKCLSCHNDQLQEGGFSLTSPNDLLESGYLDMEEVSASHLLALVTPVDGIAEMPKSASPLSNAEIGVLRKWIGFGAVWPEGHKLQEEFDRNLDWWSLRPIPDLGDSSVRKSEGVNPIDRLVDARLQSLGIKPVQRADARTLLRRLSYCLTGLPPTVEEMQVFLDAAKVDGEQAWLADCSSQTDLEKNGPSIGSTLRAMQRLMVTTKTSQDRMHGLIAIT